MHARLHRQPVKFMAYRRDRGKISSLSLIFDSCLMQLLSSFFMQTKQDIWELRDRSSRKEWQFDCQAIRIAIVEKF